MTRFTALYPQFVGFDNIFNELERLVDGTTPTRNTSFPPHNIIKTGENQFRIELAVAGFDENELDVSLTNRVLVIKGERIRDDDADQEYLHRGIASRNFERSFPLADNVEVRAVTVRNGIMSVSLELVIPEEEKAPKMPGGMGGEMY